MDNKKTTTFLESLKTVKPSDLVYPGIVIFFIILTSILLFFATSFISKNINKVFAPEEEGASQALDRSRYELVAKKLGIEIPKQKEVETSQVDAVSPEATTTAPILIEKDSLTIVVKNSTRKSGIGAALAKSIEAGGFKKPETGNEPNLYATTTVFLNSVAKQHETELLDIVHKSYPSAIATTSPETSTADATVIIGSN